MGYGTTTDTDIKDDYTQGQTTNKGLPEDNAPPTYTPPAYTPPAYITPESTETPEIPQGGQGGGAGAQGGMGGPGGGGTDPGGDTEEDPGGDEPWLPPETNYGFPFDPETPPTPTVPNVLEGFVSGVLIYDGDDEWFTYSHEHLTDLETFDWALSELVNIPFEHMPITLTALETSQAGNNIQPLTVYLSLHDSDGGEEDGIGSMKFVVSEDLNSQIPAGTIWPRPGSSGGSGNHSEEWAGKHFGIELPIYNWMANPITEIGLEALATDQYVYQYETDPDDEMIQYRGQYHKHSDNTLVTNVTDEILTIGDRHEFNPITIIEWSDIFEPELPPVPFETIQDVREAVSDTFYKLFFENNTISLNDEDIRKSQTTIRDGKQKTGRTEEDKLVFYKKDRNTLENRKDLQGDHFKGICQYLYDNYPELTYNELINNYGDYFELIIVEQGLEPQGPG